MRTPATLAVLAAFGALSTAGAQAGTFTNLYDFQIKPDLGQLPGPVTIGGTTLYGTVTNGAGTPTSDQACNGYPDRGCGAVFSYIPGGTPVLIHAFSGTDGAHPSGRLHLKGTVLYGLTDYGGASGDGVLFSLNTDGTDFRVIYTFTSYHTDIFAMDDAENVYSFAGATLFRIDPTGTYSVVKQLTKAEEGNFGDIVEDRKGNVLGTYSSVKTAGYTTSVFRYHTASASFDILYRSHCDCTLNLGGVDESGTLYGYSDQSSQNPYYTGVLFSLAPSASGYQFTLLHEFQYGRAHPTTLHVALNGTLVGNTVSTLGRNFITYSGTLFRYKDGAFRVLHKFPFNDQYGGSYPENVPDVTPDGVIYGTTFHGGLVNGAKHDNCNQRGRYTHGCGIIYSYSK